MGTRPIINRHGDAGFDATGTLVIPSFDDRNTSARVTIDGMDLLDRIREAFDGDKRETMVVHNIRITVEQLEREDAS